MGSSFTPKPNRFPWRNARATDGRRKTDDLYPEGLRVPVPKRSDFFRNLGKVAKSRRSPTGDRVKDRGDEITEVVPDPGEGRP